MTIFISMQKSFSCRYCMKSYHAKWQLYQHRQMFHNIGKAGPHTCPLSGKTFSYEWQMLQLWFQVALGE